MLKCALIAAAATAQGLAASSGADAPVQRRVLAASDGGGNSHATRLYPGQRVSSTLSQVGHLDGLTEHGLRCSRGLNCELSAQTAPGRSDSTACAQGGAADVYVIGSTMAGTTPDFLLTLTWSGGSPVQAYCRPATNTAADAQPPGLSDASWNSSERLTSLLSRVCVCARSHWPAHTNCSLVPLPIGDAWRLMALAI